MNKKDFTFNLFDKIKFKSIIDIFVIDKTPYRYR